MQTIKAVDKSSIGNVYAFFLAISAFLMGLSIAFANIAGRIMEGGASAGAIAFIVLFNILYGILVGLVSALVGAIIGYVSGYIFASLYNTAVRIKLLKGVKVEFE